jgi:uncharacterized protein
MEERYGDWMQTWTGKRFYPLDPRPEDFDIDDIGHALANVCRFAGHSREFYSVAQHSFYVSALLPPPLAKLGLLHDAAEAYIGDMVRPLKRMAEMQVYCDLETRLWGCIAAKFDLLDVSDPEGLLKTADNIMLATERRDLFHKPMPWSPLPEPLPNPITPWTPMVARNVFLERYYELTGVPADIATREPHLTKLAERRSS